MDSNLNLNQTILNLTSVYFGIGLTKGVVTIHFGNLIYSSEWALERAFETQFRVICDSDMFTRIILNIPFFLVPIQLETQRPIGTVGQTIKSHPTSQMLAGGPQDQGHGIILHDQGEDYW